MSGDKTYRPRISRDLRDYVINVAEELNGAEVSGFHSALELLTRYISILQRNPPCPDCGEETAENPNRYATFRCPSCAEDFHAYDVLDVDDTENARLPPLPAEVKTGFKCDCNDETTADNRGTTGSTSVRTTDSRQDSADHTDPFEW